MTTTTMKERLLNREYDAVLQEVYLDSNLLEGQRIRYVKAVERFEKLYGVKEVKVFSAPGRTEIGGNHTDHQNGRVLAASINLDAIAVAARTDDNCIRILSQGYPAITMDLNDLDQKAYEEGTTQALIRGVANGVSRRGYQIGGFEAYVTSDVLRGSGLSSSAAYEILIGSIFSGLYNENKLDSITLAQIGQEAEMIYFGKPCGLMDQMACSVGGMIFIDFAQSEKPEVRKVHVDFQKFGHCLCIVDTKGSHADLTDEYAAVPAEMKRVAAYFGKELLCQVDKELFYSELARLRKQSGDRAVMRAMHWYEENARVDAEVKALEALDFEHFKEIVKASGDSSYKYLQNVFSVKNIGEQGVSLALALSEMILGDAGVCRVHGGGFAGTMQAFVPAELVQKYRQRMEEVFGEGTCYVLQIRADGGRQMM